MHRPFSERKIDSKVASLNPRYFSLLSSKAYNLIKRFSEDVDFRVIAATTPQSRKTLSKFKHGVVENLQQSGFAIEEGHIQARDENRFFSIDFCYPSHFSRSDALRPHVQIEPSVAYRLPHTDLEQKNGKLLAVNSLQAVLPLLTLVPIARL